MCKISENICLKKKSKKIIILRISNLFGNFRDKPSFIEKIIHNYLYKKQYKLNKEELIIYKYCTSYILYGESCK